MSETARQAARYVLSYMTAYGLKLRLTETGSIAVSPKDRLGAREARMIRENKAAIIEELEEFAFDLADGWEEPVNDPARFDELPDESDEEATKQDVLDFIAVYLAPGFETRSSYGLKEDFERDFWRATGRNPYISNGAFKGAMLRYGYYPTHDDGVNAYYEVTRRRLAPELVPVAVTVIDARDGAVS